MTVIRRQDLVDTIAGALQYISYYHPQDYIANLAKAYEKEESPAAKDAIAQILINSRMCAEGHRPICQDTGVVNVFLKIGMEVRFAGPDGARPPRACRKSWTRAYARPIWTPTTSSGPACLPIQPGPAKIPATTRPAW